MAGVKYVKLLALILGVVVINVFVLSPGLLGIAIGESAFSTAFGITLLLASTLALLFGGYTILIKQPVVIPIKNMSTHEDYVDALIIYRRVRVIEADITIALEQLERLKKKNETLIHVLRQRFDPTELSFRKFASTINEVEKLFYLNVRSILNRLNVFDEAEFNRLMSQTTPRFTKELLQEKTELYHDFLSFMKYSLGTNEEILLKLDKLLLEISRLDSFAPEDIEKMACMQEIDTLIKQTKYYKE